LVALAVIVTDPRATPSSCGVDVGVMEPASNTRVVAENVNFVVSLLLKVTNTVDAGAEAKVTGNATF